MELSLSDDEHSQACLRVLYLELQQVLDYPMMLPTVLRKGSHIREIVLHRSLKFERLRMYVFTAKMQ